MQSITPRRKMDKKIGYAVLVFFVIFALLFVKLVWLQVVRHPELSKKAIEQQTKDEVIASKRGTIYDCNMKPLAISASAQYVSADAKAIYDDKQDVHAMADALAPVLSMDAAAIEQKLEKNKNYRDVIIKRRIDPEIAEQVKALDFKGIYLKEDTKRYYPYGTFASQILGFTGADDQGLGGIEMVYDKELKGVSGRLITLQDALTIEMPNGDEVRIDAQNGTNIVLTIDEAIQHFVEKHLGNAYAEEACQQGAAAIVMDVKTGGVLAMASKPDFDLNNPFSLVDRSEQTRIDTISDETERTKTKSDALQKMWRNKAVVDSYEPGSCFKIMTAAMALEENAVNLDDKFFCTGSKKVDVHTIKCWKAGGHGAETFVDGVKNSCNPVFIEVGQRVGQVNFLKYYKAFGFRDVTGFDLPGEANGVFYSEGGFNITELSTASFGQGPKITPLQMISAVCCVANGGNLMKPFLVKELVDDDGNVIKATEPTVVRQVISQQTSETMRMLLENVVANGGGQNAYIKGFRVAGKTGTSEKIPRGNGKYIASFVGFAPANDPKVACLVILDEPSNGEYYGGRIAAPVVGKIMEDTLRYLNVEPQYTDEEKAEMEVFVPDVKGLNITNASKRLSTEGLKYSVVGSGDTVTDQMPKLGASLSANSVVLLYTDEESQATMVTVPDISGMTLNNAKNTLLARNLNLSSVSAGATGNTSYSTIAVTQDPAPGSSVQAGSVVRVEFRYLDVE